MTRGKTANVVAALKRMKAVRAGADERWIVMRPSLGPIATKNIPERDAEIIGNDQADTCDQQHLLPALKWAPRPSNNQDRQHQSRPILYFWRWIREPSKNLDRVDVVVIDEERHRAIDPKVTDQDGNNAYGRYHQRASQQTAIVVFVHRYSTGTSNWL